MARRKCGFEVDCIRREQDAFLDLLAKKGDPNFKPIAEKPLRPVAEDNAVSHLHSSAQPSFDCANVLDADEAVICKNDDLAAREKLDDQTFTKLFQQSNMAQSAIEARSEFIAARHKCGSEVACIRREQDAFLDLLTKKADPDFKPVAEKPLRPSAEVNGVSHSLPSPARSIGADIISIIPALLRGISIASAGSCVLACIFLLGHYSSRLGSAERSGWTRNHRLITSVASRVGLPVRTGALLDVNGRHLSDCSIVDRSKTGAKIRIAEDLGSVRLIRFRDDVEDTTFVTEVAWRRGNELGLKFLDELSDGEAVSPVDPACESKTLRNQYFRRTGGDR